VTETTFAFEHDAGRVLVPQLIFPPCQPGVKSLPQPLTR